MTFRVVKSTDRGYIAVSGQFHDLSAAVHVGKSLKEDDPDSFYAIQEMPSGAVTLDIRLSETTTS